VADGSQIIAKCENCHQPTAPQAAVCPNCGALNVSNERDAYIKRKNQRWLWVLGGIAFLGCLLPAVLALGLLATCLGQFNPH
jgi:hypothetical protein